MEVKTERREGEGRQQHCALQRYNYQNFKDTFKKSIRKVSVDIQDKINFCKITERTN